MKKAGYVPRELRTEEEEKQLIRGFLATLGCEICNLSQG